MTKALDLGCGLNPRNPFNCDELYGIDIRENKDKKIYNIDLIVDPIPFKDNFFDYVTALRFYRTYTACDLSSAKEISIC
jgi:hypothetical protein